jgi:hypothetical protein
MSAGKGSRNRSANRNYWESSYWDSKPAVGPLAAAKDQNPAKPAKKKAAKVKPGSKKK